MFEVRPSPVYMPSCVSEGSGKILAKVVPDSYVQFFHNLNSSEIGKNRTRPSTEPTIPHVPKGKPRDRVGSSVGLHPEETGVNSLLHAFFPAKMNCNLVLVLESRNHKCNKTAQQNLEVERARPNYNKNSNFYCYTEG